MDEDISSIYPDIQCYLAGNDISDSKVFHNQLVVWQG